MRDYDLPRAALNLLASVRKEASALDNLPGAALAGVLAGSIVVGTVMGGLLWIPAAVSGAVLTFRTVAAVIRFSNDTHQRKIALIGQTRLALEEVEHSNLPELQKDILAQMLMDNLGAQDPKRLVAHSPHRHKQPETLPNDSDVDSPRHPLGEGVGASEAPDTIVKSSRIQRRMGSSERSSDLDQT